MSRLHLPMLLSYRDERLQLHTKTTRIVILIYFDCAGTIAVEKVSPRNKECRLNSRASNAHPVASCRHS